MKSKISKISFKKVGSLEISVEKSPLFERGFRGVLNSKVVKCY